jgi:hypothetical protein
MRCAYSDSQHMLGRGEHVTRFLSGGRGQETRRAKILQEKGKRFLSRILAKAAQVLHR